MGADAPGAGRIRVVLADDDDLFVESLRPLVDGQDGLEVVATAHDGLETIELVDELHPDAVVVDLHMPLLDGVTAVARMRRDHPSLCMIALTGDEAPALHRAAEEAGADAVLQKDEFVQTLLAASTRSRAALELAAGLFNRSPDSCDDVPTTAPKAKLTHHLLEEFVLGSDDVVRLEPARKLDELRLGIALDRKANTNRRPRPLPPRFERRGCRTQTFDVGRPLIL